MWLLLWTQLQVVQRLLPGMLQEMADQKKEGGKDMLQLLNEVSGAFQPGILTALVGVSGAGKTTLMDVLAGRKTGLQWPSCVILPCLSCWLSLYQVRV